MNKFIKNPTTDRKHESGQSTIEFALTMILFLGFFLFYFQICMSFAFGSYAHYATFMAARALYAAGGGSGPDQKEQITRATTVVVAMLKKSAGQAGTDKFPSIAKAAGGGDPTGATIGEGAQFQQGNRAYSWQQGVRYSFTSKLFIIPFAGSDQSGGSSPNQLALTSESWLGRSVSFRSASNIWDSKVEFLTMDANTWPTILFMETGEAGQSVLEFLLMLPMLVGFVMILMKVNTAIQISIVDQQYARAQTLFLTMNSPFYPTRATQAALVSVQTNSMLVGVSNNQSTPGYTPSATTQWVARTSNAVGADNSPKSEPKRRASVRIRNSVTLCTQNLYLKSSSGQNVAIFDGSTNYNLNEQDSLALFQNVCVGTTGYE